MICILVDPVLPVAPVPPLPPAYGYELYSKTNAISRDMLNQTTIACFIRAEGTTM